MLKTALFDCAINKKHPSKTKKMLMSVGQPPPPPGRGGGWAQLELTDAFRSTLFVSAFQGSLLVIALFREIVDQFYSKIFLIFLILVSCKNKAMSASCPRQKFHSSSQFPPLFLSSLESFSVFFFFLRAKLRCIVICINSTPTQMIDGTEKPIRSLQTRSAIQRI